MATPDKTLVRRRFARGLASYRDHATVQQECAVDLLATLAAVTPEREFRGRILEIGGGAGVLSDLLVARYAAYRELVVLDIVPECAPCHEARPRCRFLAGDVESLPLPEACELVISNATLQWMNDLPTLMKRIHAALEPEGILAFTSFGTENMREITRLTGVGLHYLPTPELREALGMNFELLALRETERVLEFPTPEAVLRHLRLTGVNGGATVRWTRGTLNDFSRRYREEFQLANGKFPLTFHPITLIARKK